MASQNEGIKSFNAGADLEAYRRVKLSGSDVVYAGAGEAFIGVTQAKALQNTPVPIRLRTPGKTFMITAVDAISNAASFYGAANGKISASVSGSVQGSVLEATTADNDVVECIIA